MSKEKTKDKTKTTFLETARTWITKHGSEGLDLKAVNAAVAAVEKRTAEAQAAASKLGEILEARKGAMKALKDALKGAKAARKAPKAVPPKTAVPKKATVKKAVVKPTATKSE